MKLSIKCILLYITAVHLVAVKPENENFLLPKNCKPVHYKVHYFLSKNFFEGQETRLSALAEIRFFINKTTNFIFLHSDAMHTHLNSISLQKVEIPGRKYHVEYDTDIVKIYLDPAIRPGTEYLLTIRYTAVLTSEHSYGLRRKEYVDFNGNKKYFLSTMFSATHARWVFPCFDEPIWKAKFNFSFSIPLEFEVISNTLEKRFPDPQDPPRTDSSLKVVVFEETPLMSTYLLAFVISEFTCTTPGIDQGVVTRICTNYTSGSSRELAMRYAPQLLKIMNELIGYDYKNTLKKLDHVVIPNIEKEVIAHWGLIYYRERNLLWNRDYHTSSDMQRVVTTIANGIAQQWFGSLVTMAWWSDSLLTHAFGTYFGYYLTHKVRPEWELDKQFVIEKLQLALSTDVPKNTQPLQSNCSTQKEIRTKFQDILYNKGSSILRMVEHFMKTENFFAGLRDYIKTYSFKSTTLEDLWLTLNKNVDPFFSKLPDSFTTVMQNWMTTPGFPLIRVSVYGNIATISQKRFLFFGNDSSTLWYVPISYSLSVDSDKFEKTTPNFWLTPFKPAVNITLPDKCNWIILNNQQSAYYRVFYDNTSLTNIVTALMKDDFDGIGDLNRAHIIDDLFSLVKVNLTTYSTILKVMKFMRNDTSYYPWYVAFRKLEELLTKVGYDTAAGIKITGILLNITQPFYSSTPLWNTDENHHLNTLKSVMISQWACLLGNKDCVNTAKELFKSYKYTNKKPKPNIRKIVYCNGLRYSDDDSDWDFMWQAYINAGSDLEKDTLLYGLTCTNDKLMIEKLLEKTIENETYFTKQRVLLVYNSICNGREKGINILLAFLKINYYEIVKKYECDTEERTFKELASKLTTKNQLDQFQDIADRRHRKIRSYVQAGVENLEFNRLVKNDLEIFIIDTEINIYSTFDQFAIILISIHVLYVGLRIFYR